MEGYIVHCNNSYCNLVADVQSREEARALQEAHECIGGTVKVVRYEEEEYRNGYLAGIGEVPLDL